MKHELYFRSRGIEIWLDATRVVAVENHPEEGVWLHTKEGLAVVVDDATPDDVRQWIKTAVGKQ